MTQAWDTECSNHTTKLVLIALADNANDQGVCWPSVPTLAKKCGLTRQGVMAQIGKLEEAKLLTVERTNGRGNRYVLNPSTRLTTHPSTRLTPPVNAVDAHPSTPLTGPVNAVDPNHKEPPLEPPRTGGKFVLPVGLAKSPLAEAWEEWLTYRKELRAPMTPSTFARQVKLLGELSPERGAACIQFSITNGWRGLFPERFLVKNVAGQPGYVRGQRPPPRPGENTLPSGQAYRKRLNIVGGGNAQA